MTILTKNHWDYLFPLPQCVLSLLTWLIWKLSLLGSIEFHEELPSVSRLWFIGSQVEAQSSRFSSKTSGNSTVLLRFRATGLKSSAPLSLKDGALPEALWHSEFCHFPVPHETPSHLTPPTYSWGNLWGSVGEPWFQIKWIEGWPNCSPVLLYAPQPEYPFWTQPSLDSAH